MTSLLGQANLEGFSIAKIMLSISPFWNRASTMRFHDKPDVMQCAPNSLLSHCRFPGLEGWKTMFLQQNTFHIHFCNIV